MGQGCAKVCSGDKSSIVISGKVDEKRLAFIAGVPLFSYLEFEDHELIAKCMEEKEFADKEEVVHEGDAGDVMYIIQTGKAIVLAGSTQVAKLGAGDYFGEYALLWDQPRSASVAAKGALKCDALTRDRFDKLDLKSLLHFPRRACLSAGGDSKSSQHGKKSKKRKSAWGVESDLCEEDLTLIADSLGRNEKLHEAMEFTRETLETMARHCKEIKVKIGDKVIKEKDKVAEEMYVVKEGHLNVSIKESSPEATRGAFIHVGDLKAGDSFGELALIFNAPRKASVLAASDCTLFSLHRSALKVALRTVADKRIDEVARFIGQMPCLTGLLAEERKACAEAFIAVHFEEGEEVFRKGDDATEFMILKKGEIVIEDGKNLDDPRYDTVAGPPLVACEEFLSCGKYKETMHAGLDGALVYFMDRDTFKMLLSGVEYSIKEAIGFDDGGKQPPKKKKTTFAIDTEVHRRYPEADFQNLTKLRVLGTGAHGVVWLVQQKSGGSCCNIGHGGLQMAMKVVGKGLIAKDKLQVAIQSERKVLAAMAENPLIIHLYGTHKDAENLYFLMEAATMDILHAYAMNKLFGKAPVAAYHVASLACALEALHVRRIAYRDVKPENMLLDEAGRAKLCDMGIAKFVPGLTYSVVGTPEYCAPEVFSGQGYSPSCDWWSLGVLVFELMTGGNPFSKGHDMLQTITAVKKGFSGAKSNDNIPYTLEKNSPDAVTLIKAVCQVKPKHRLPVGKTGQDDTAKFKEHVWFKDVDWEGILHGTMEAPFVPPDNLKTKLGEPRPEDMPEDIEYTKDHCDFDEDF